MGANVQGEMFEYHLRSCILCAGYIMIQVKPKSVSECLQDFSEELDDLGHLHMHFSCSFHDKIVSQTENILPWKVSVFLKHTYAVFNKDGNYSPRNKQNIPQLTQKSNKQITIKWDFLYITHTCFFAVVVVFLFF